VASAVAPGLPQLFGAVTGVIGLIVKLCEQAAVNRKQCADLARRYQAVGAVLLAIDGQLRGGAEEYAGPKVHILQLVLDKLEDLRELVAAYSQRGSVMVRLTALAFHAQFEPVDAELSRLVDALQLGLLSSVIDGNRRLLAAAPTAEQIAALDDKLDAANAKLDLLTAEHSARGERERRQSRSVFVVSRFQIPSSDLHFDADADTIAEGGFATVYRATWRGQPVCAKQMRLGPKGISKQALAEFNKELQLMCDLRHPRLVTVFGAVTDLAQGIGSRLVLVCAAARPRTRGEGLGGDGSASARAADSSAPRLHAARAAGDGAPREGFAARGARLCRLPAHFAAEGAHPAADRERPRAPCDARAAHSAP
jgi:hypothetical protein